MTGTWKIELVGREHCCRRQGSVPASWQIPTAFLLIVVAVVLASGSAVSGFETTTSSTTTCSRRLPRSRLRLAPSSHGRLSSQTNSNCGNNCLFRYFSEQSFRPAHPINNIRTTNGGFRFNTSRDGFIASTTYPRLHVLRRKPRQPVRVIGVGESISTPNAITDEKSCKNSIYGASTITWLQQLLRRLHERLCGGVDGFVLGSLFMPLTLSLRSPLVRSNDVWGNYMVLLGVAFLGQVLGATTTAGRLLGSPVCAMAVTFALASTGVLPPGGTRGSASLQKLVLYFSTPLVLLGAELRGKDTVKKCGSLLLSFVAASSATLLACVVGWSAAGRELVKSLGPRDGVIIASALLAKNIGGGINYIAVCQTLQASPVAVTAGLCIDNIFALVYFPLSSALASKFPDVIADFGPTAGDDGAENNNNDDDYDYDYDCRNNSSAPMNNEDNDKINSVDDAENDASTMASPFAANSSSSSAVIRDVTFVLFLSTSLLWAGERISKRSMVPILGTLPVCTLLSVLTSSLAPTRVLSPSIRSISDVLGTVCLYIFFSTAGSSGIVVAGSVRRAMVPLGKYLLSLYSVHGAMLYVCYRIGRCLRRRHRPEDGARGAVPSSTLLGEAFRGQRLLVSSSAAIGGPATAVTLAQSSKWKSLVVPSLLVGNIGYAIATFVGLLFAQAIV